MSHTVTHDTWDDNNFLPGDYAANPVIGWPRMLTGVGAQHPRVETIPRWSRWRVPVPWADDPEAVRDAVDAFLARTLSAR